MLFTFSVPGWNATLLSIQFCATQPLGHHLGYCYGNGFYAICLVKGEVSTHNISLYTFVLEQLYGYELVTNTYTVRHGEAKDWLILYVLVNRLINSFALIPRPLLSHTGSVTGLLGESASSFYLPPPESRPRDPIDRVLALSLVPLHGGWTQAPTEVPVFVPEVAPSRQEPSGPLPSPPKKRYRGSARRLNVGGYLQF